MTQTERETYLLKANRKITKLLSKRFPDTPRITDLRTQRDAVLAEYVVNNGQRWCGNS